MIQQQLSIITLRFKHAKTLKDKTRQQGVKSQIFKGNVNIINMENANSPNMETTPEVTVVVEGGGNDGTSTPIDNGNSEQLAETDLVNFSRLEFNKNRKIIIKNVPPCTYEVIV